MGFINSLDDEFENSREGFEKKLMFLAQISYEKNEIYQSNKEEILDYIKNLNETDNTLFFEYYMDVASKNPERLIKSIEIASMTSFFNMPIDEIRDSEKNPYGIKILKLLLAFLISTSVCVILNLLFYRILKDAEVAQNIVNGVYFIFAVYISIDFGAKVNRYLMFKKLKKALKTSEEKNDDL